jgi:hypothetical protein
MKGLQVESGMMRCAIVDPLPSAPGAASGSRVIALTR